MALLLATALLLLATPAQASTPVIRIVDLPHTNYDGTFRDNKLATALLPSGKLGALIYTDRPAVTWVIDAALVDEVIDMSDGYTFEDREQVDGRLAAVAWLNQLRAATIGDPIVALAYGNPDEALARNIGGNEINFYYAIAAQKLEGFFGKAVISQNGWGKGTSALSHTFQRTYSRNRTVLVGLSKVISDPQITSLRLQLGRVLNPLLNFNERALYSYSAQKAVDKMASKLKVISGRYQLTSENVEVPITLTNKFETSTIVNLSLTAMNSRVRVSNLMGVEIPAKTSIQLSVPFQVIAPGSTLVVAQFTSNDGQLIGQRSKLYLSMTVIDSRVTWFTTAAAIALLLGAVAQSVRRFRKGRHEK